MSEGREERVSAGKRIKFIKHENLLMSHKVYSDGDKVIRLIINTESMEFFLTDPVTGYVHRKGGNVTNLEVLQRKAKRELKKFLGLYFEKEVRNVASKSE